MEDTVVPKLGLWASRKIQSKKGTIAAPHQQMKNKIRWEIKLSFIL